MTNNANPPFSLDLPPMPQGEVARQLKAPFQKFWISIYPYIRKEKFGFNLRDGKLDPNWKPNVVKIAIEHSVFKALLKEAEATRQAGTYKIAKESFTLMLFDTGKIIFYPSDLPENSARAFLYWLTTPPPVGMGLTRVQALYLMSILELFSLECESPVIGDPYGILPNARIGVTIFDPVPYFGPETIEHFADVSKKKEIGTRKSPRAASDVQEMIAKPVRVEGWIRRIPPAIVGLGEKFNELIQNFNQNMQLAIEMSEVHSDNERHLKRSLRTLGKDLGVHVLLHQESLKEQKRTNKYLRKIMIGQNNQAQEQAEFTRQNLPNKQGTSYKRGPYDKSKKPKLSKDEITIYTFVCSVPRASAKDVLTHTKVSSPYYLLKKLVKKQKVVEKREERAPQPLSEEDFLKDLDELNRDVFDGKDEFKPRKKRGPKWILYYSKAQNSSSGTS